MGSPWGTYSEHTFPGPAHGGWFRGSGVGFIDLPLYQDPGLREAGCDGIMLLRMGSFHFFQGAFDGSFNSMMLLSGKKPHVRKFLVFRNLGTVIFNSAKDAF